MAAEIERMFYTGETPWHGLGEGIEKAKTDPIFMSPVHTEPLYRVIDPTAEDGQPDGYAPVAAQCVVRDIDGKILSHHVGPEWTPYQPTDGVAYFQQWEDAGFIKLETAGSLRGGQIQWILGRINKDPMVVKGDDIVLKYVLLTWGHGTWAIRNGFTPTRVVCMNTLSAAIGDADSALIKVSHTKNCVTNVEKLRDVMNLADQQFEATADQYRYLASRDIDAFDLRRYVKVVLKRPENEAVSVVTPTERKVIELFQGSGKGSQLESARGTWWGAYNAVAEHLTWEKGNDRANRLEGLWLGGGKTVNRAALDIAVRMAA